MESKQLRGRTELEAEVREAGRTINEEHCQSLSRKWQGPGAGLVAM